MPSPSQRTDCAEKPGHCGAVGTQAPGSSLGSGLGSLGQSLCIPGAGLGWLHLGEGVKVSIHPTSLLMAETQHSVPHFPLEMLCDLGQVSSLL